jgi:hypothetical protein
MVKQIKHFEAYLNSTYHEQMLFCPTIQIYGDNDSLNNDKEQGLSLHD